MYQIKKIGLVRPMRNILRVRLMGNSETNGQHFFEKLVCSPLVSPIVYQLQKFIQFKKHPYTFADKAWNNYASLISFQRLAPINMIGILTNLLRYRSVPSEWIVDSNCFIFHSYFVVEFEARGFISLFVTSNWY
jgi:hypothetical protein